MRSRNQRSWLMTTAQPAKDSSASSSARSVSTSRSLVGSSSSSRFAAALEQLRQVDAVALAARERADLALLIAPLEVEPRDVGARRDLALAELDVVAAAGDLLPHGLVRATARRATGRRSRPCTVSPSRSVPPSGCSCPGDHPEQRRLAGAVRADHADDAAARQREVDVVHQQHVAVALAQAARLDDDVAEPRARRDVDLDLIDLLRGLFLQQVLVGVEARLALGLPRARRHADPLQLARERALPLRSPASLRARAASASARARTSSCLPTGCREPRSSSRIQPATLSRK